MRSSAQPRRKTRSRAAAQFQPHACVYPVSRAARRAARGLEPQPGPPSPRRTRGFSCERAILLTVSYGSICCPRRTRGFSCGAWPAVLYPGESDPSSRDIDHEPLHPMAGAPRGAGRLHDRTEPSPPALTAAVWRGRTDRVGHRCVFFAETRRPGPRGSHHQWSTRARPTSGESFAADPDGRGCGPGADKPGTRFDSAQAGRLHHAHAPRAAFSGRPSRT